MYQKAIEEEKDINESWNDWHISQKYEKGLGQSRPYRP